MEWYAVQTKPRQEKTAETSLNRFGVSVFSPRLKTERIVRRKARTLVSPLFPGYLFARFDLQADYRKVRYAHGVRDIVSQGGKPIEVGEGVISTIQARVVGGHVALPQRGFQKGEVVRIQGGPFEGFEAVFEREMPAQQRVVLLLTAIRYRARVVIDRRLICGGQDRCSMRRVTARL